MDALTIGDAAMAKALREEAAFAAQSSLNTPDEWAAIAQNYLINGDGKSRAMHASAPNGMQIELHSARVDGRWTLRIVVPGKGENTLVGPQAIKAVAQFSAPR